MILFFPFYLVKSENVWNPFEAMLSVCILFHFFLIKSNSSLSKEQTESFNVYQALFWNNTLQQTPRKGMFSRVVDCSHEGDQSSDSLVISIRPINFPLNKIDLLELKDVSIGILFKCMCLLEIDQIIPNL